MGSKNKTSDKEKEQIRALLATGKSKNEVAKKVGVSWATVDKVSKEAPDKLENLREKKKEQFVNQAWDQINDAMRLGHQKIKLATVTLDSFQEQIDRLIDLLEDNDEVNGRDVIDCIKALSSVTSIPLSHISTYFGTLYDKAALAAGEATGRHEHTGKDGGPIETAKKVDLSGLSDEELVLLEKIANRNPEP